MKELDNLKDGPYWSLNSFTLPFYRCRNSLPRYTHIWLHNQVCVSNAVAAMSILALMITLLSCVLPDQSTNTLAEVLLWLAESVGTMSPRTPSTMCRRMGKTRLQEKHKQLAKAVYVAFSGNREAERDGIPRLLRASPGSSQSDTWHEFGNQSALGVDWKASAIELLGTRPECSDLESPTLNPITLGQEPRIDSTCGRTVPNPPWTKYVLREGTYPKCGPEVQFSFKQNDSSSASSMTARKSQGRNCRETFSSTTSLSGECLEIN